MIRVLLVEPNKEPRFVEIPSDCGDAIRDLLNGGYMQMLRLARDACAFVDEEGDIKNLPVNQTATLLCEAVRIGLGVGDRIVGPMVIAGLLNDKGEHDSETHSLPKRWQDAFTTPIQREAFLAFLSAIRQENIGG